jgi:hypothetical protein
MTWRFPEPIREGPDPQEAGPHQQTAAAAGATAAGASLSMAFPTHWTERNCPAALLEFTVGLHFRNALSDCAAK